LFGILLDIGQRHLVRAPEAFQSVTFNLDRGCPALGERKTIIGQRGRPTVDFFRASC
jgi:hypothetical protein